MALDEAAQRTTKAYLATLARGRKATAAKDYAQADEHFSKCLELAPGDARALADRGYARLLAGKLPEAETDLAAAANSAPNASLRSQILHNRMLAARQAGDEQGAAVFEHEKKKLKAAQRLSSGVSCGTETNRSSLKPERPQSLDEAFKLIVAAHAKEAQIDPGGVTFESDAQTTHIADTELRKLADGGPLRDGGWTLATSGNDDTTANHVLISRGGKLYLHPSLSFGRISRCGQDGLADLKVAGGVVVPWHIVRTMSRITTAHPSGDDGSPGQPYCAWTTTKADLIVLDAITFEGITEFSVLAQPKDEGGASIEPAHLLEFEWQTEQVAVKACGSRELVPYAR